MVSSSSVPDVSFNELKSWKYENCLHNSPKASRERERKHHWNHHEYVCASGDACVYEKVAVFYDENKNSKMPRNTHSNMQKRKKE